MSNETRSANIVLLLDLATDNPVDATFVQPHLPPDVDAPVMQLTNFRVRPTRDGTPANWRPVISAIDRLLDAAREQAAPGCRYWIAGRLGLPGFFYIGYQLGKLAQVTLLNQRPGGFVDVLALDHPEPLPVRNPYFTTTTWPSQPVQDSIEVALAIAAKNVVSPEEARRAIRETGPEVTDVIEAQTPAFFGAENVATAMSEVEERTTGIHVSYPRCRAVHFFPAGPATLAFIAGRYMNHNLFPRVRVYDRYQVAFDTQPQWDQRKILFLAASPSDENPLDLKQEAKEIEETLPDNSRFEFVTRHAVRLTELRKAIHETRPIVVHFSGHGNRGHLALEREDGTKDVVTPDEIDRVFNQAGVAPAIVVLSACYSKPLANRLLEYADCVIAMNTTIQQSDAIRFATALYTALSEGASIQIAFDDAKRAIRSIGTEATIDVRPGVDATRRSVFWTG